MYSGRGHAERCHGHVLRPTSPRSASGTQRIGGLLLPGPPFQHATTRVAAPLRPRFANAASAAHLVSDTPSGSIRWPGAPADAVDHYRSVDAHTAAVIVEPLRRTWGAVPRLASSALWAPPSPFPLVLYMHVALHLTLRGWRDEGVPRVSGSDFDLRSARSRPTRSDRIRAGPRWRPTDCDPIDVLRCDRYAQTRFTCLSCSEPLSLISQPLISGPSAIMLLPFSGGISRPFRACLLS